MTTDRERKELLNEMQNWPFTGIERLGELLNEAETEITILMRENEALRKERDNATSNFIRESRENEALRKQLATWHRHQTGDK